MSSKKGVITLILCILFLLPAVSAFTAHTGKTSISACACGVDTIDYITVENTATTSQSYMVKTTGTAETWVSTAQNFILKPGEKKELPIFMTAPCGARGQYTAEYSISTNTQTKTLSHSINVQKCQNIDVTAESLSITTNPCEAGIYELTIYNTGTSLEQYKLSFTGNKDWLTVSESQLSLSPKSNKTIYIYALAPCETYGEFEFTAYIETQISNYITQIPLTLNILRNYAFSLQSGEYGEVTQNNETLYTFIPKQDTYKICEKEQKQIPLKLTNEVHFPNRYTFKLEGEDWGEIVEKSLTVQENSSDIATLYLEPKLGDVGEYEFNIRAYAQRGKVYSDTTINVEVEACYFLDIKPIDPVDLCTGDITSIPIEIENNGAYDEPIQLQLEGSSCLTIPNNITIGSKQTETIELEYNSECQETGTRQITVTAVLKNETRVQSQQTFEANLNDMLGCYNTKIDSTRLRVTEPTELILNLHNKGTRSIDYDLAVEGQEWVSVDPETITIEPQESGEFTLDIDPTDQAADLYPITVNAQVGNKIVFSRKSLIIVGTPTTLQYLLHYLAWTIIVVIILLALLVLVILWLRNLFRTYETHRWKLIEKGSKERAKIKTDMLVTELSFSLQEQQRRIKLRVEQFRRNKTKERLKEDLVYGYFELDPSFGKHAAREGHVIIKVKRSWLSKNNLAQSAVTAKHFTNKWKETQIRKVESDNKYVYYKLPLDIGHYAITAPRPKPKPEPKKPEPKKENKVKPLLVKAEEKKKKRQAWPWVLLILLIIIAAGIGTYIYLKATPTVITGLEPINDTTINDTIDTTITTDTLTGLEQQPNVLTALKSAFLSYLPYMIAGFVVLLIIISLSLLFAGKGDKKPKEKKPEPKKKEEKKPEKKVEVKKEPKLEVKPKRPAKKKKSFPWVPLILGIIIILALGVGLTNRFLQPLSLDNITISDNLTETLPDTATNDTDATTIEPQPNVTEETSTNITETPPETAIDTEETTEPVNITLLQESLQQSLKGTLPYAIAGLILVLIVLTLILILQPKKGKKKKVEKKPGAKKKEEKPKKAEVETKPKKEVKKVKEKPGKKKSGPSWLVAIIVLIAILAGISYISLKGKVDIQSITTGSLGPKDLPNDTEITTYDREDVSLKEVVRTEPEVLSEDDIERRKAQLHNIIEEMVEDAQEPRRTSERLIPLILAGIILALLIVPTLFKGGGKKKPKNGSNKKELANKDKKKEQETKKQKPQKKLKGNNKKSGLLEKTAKGVVNFFTEEIEDNKKNK